MFTNIKSIMDRIGYLENEIKKIEEQQKKFPQGTLICAKNGPRYKWYLKDKNKNKYMYLPKSEKKLAQKLALKKYYCLREKELQEELAACKTYEDCFKRSTNWLDKFMTNKEYVNLIKDNVIPLGNELKCWLTADYERNASHPENLVVRGVDGKFLRSKSEAIIDKILFQYGIPFHYEEKKMLGSMEVYPDFTIRHPKTGEYFYWEHFGMMDNSEYASLACKKIKRYCEHEIYPAINLIMTFETKNRPLDIGQVEKIVREYFSE